MHNPISFLLLFLLLYSHTQVDEEYINAFVKAAYESNISKVKQCLSEHPEVLNLKESEVCHLTFLLLTL